ncbi:MAG: hypothetical protein WB952_07540 [Terriglobales bacterium]
MRRNRGSALALVLLSVTIAAAQVVSPAEIKDSRLRSLELQYMDELEQAGNEILADHFDYPFYLSRKLDLDELQQKRADQHSIRFDQYNDQTVVAITGNYYAAYSIDKTSSEQRARTTFLNVVMPLLQAAVPRFQGNASVQGYAVEVSHHILGKVMDVAMERPENLMVYLPQMGAIKLLGSKDDTARQAALLQGQFFLNAAPVTIWLSGEGPQLGANAPANPLRAESQPTQGSAAVGGSQNGEVAAPANLPVAPATSKPKEPAPAPPRDTSPEVLIDLRNSNQEVLEKLVKALGPQAHFVNYADPSFVVFRQGIYLELSVNTDLPESAAGSGYRVAALAFDDHISHLIRPALGYFKEEKKFDGISFSTTAHVAAKTSALKTSEAVEFFFPFFALQCYERYDCTGQQLIDAGTVLINGERVGLDLQTAEGR